MNIKKLFRSYKRKIIFESLIKSFLFGAAIGASVLFALSVVYHIRVMNPDPVIFISMTIGFFLLSSIPMFFICYYPTDKDVARRIDETGLKERVGTMLEYKDDTSEVALIQRQDAVGHLAKTSPSRLRMNIGKRSPITALVCVCLAVAVCLVPYDLFAVDISAEDPEVQREQMIEDLLEQLRDEADQLEIDDELRDKLDEIIDQMEEDLENSESDLEDAAIIDSTEDRIDDLFDDAISHDEIGEAFQHYDLISELGEAISKGDTEKVTQALDNLEDKVNEDSSLLPEISENIESALADSGIESGDELYDALKDFSSDLSALDGEDPEKTAEAFDKAEGAINEALENQAALQQAGEDFENMLSEAYDKALGKESENLADQLEAAIDAAISRDEIGDAMQEHELTKELGEAISNGDKGEVSEALENLEEKLNEDNSLIPELSEDIKSSLEESGIKSDDELYDALSDFADELANLDEDNLSEDMAEAFDRAEESIGEALDEQAALEAQMRAEANAEAENNSEQNDNSFPDMTAEEREQMISELVEQMRQQANSPEFGEQLQETLNEIIDEMEENLQNSSSHYEDALIMEEAMNEIEEAIAESVGKEEIGGALKNYELTEDLGDAIANGDTEKVSTSLNSLEAKLNEDGSLIPTLSENILSALAESGIEAGDKLFDALDLFARELASLPEEDYSKKMAIEFDEAEYLINVALGMEEMRLNQGEQMSQTLEEAMREAMRRASEQSGEPQSPESQRPSQQGNQQENNNRPGNEQTEGQEGNRVPQGIGSGERTDPTMTEGIYDPISGSVTYGEVFAAYYSEYLQAISGGEFSEEIEEIMKEYFESLND